MKKILTILLLLISIAGLGQITYYVKNGGNDAADGLSDANAWETISKVNNPGFTYDPGDFILFARGSKWEEILEARGDGVVGNPITYGAYGTGAKPIITGRSIIAGTDNAGNWTETAPGSNIWYFDVTGMGFNAGNPINRLWIDYTERRRSETLLLITLTDLFFFDNGTQRLYICSVANPSTLGDIETSNVRTRAVNLYDDNYFSFYNLDLRGGYYTVRITGASDCAGYIFDSCNIGLDTPGYGISTGISGKQLDDVIIRNCIFDSGMEIKYEIGSFYIPWTAINVTYLSDNWEIHDNYFKNWGYAGFTFIYLAGYNLTNLNFHHNEITSPDTYEGKPIGISSPNGSTQSYHHNYMHNIGVGCQMTGVGWQFYSNIIDNVRGAPLFTTVSRCGVIISNNINSDCKNIWFVNNTICNCSGPGLYLGQNSVATENTENEFINNILYNNGADEDDEQIEIRDFAVVYGNTFKNNLLFKTGITDLVNYRGAFLTVTEFNAENGNAYSEVIENNIEGDPLFVSASDFSLQSTSPAINAGIDVGLTSDYALTSVPQGIYFDIGAYEFVNFPIATTGLGWEDILSHRNFKGNVNIAGRFSVDGVPIVFSGGSPVNIPGLTASASELNKLDGAIVTTTEINYLKGVTDTIQNQLDARVALADSSATAEPNSYATGNMLEDGLALKLNLADSSAVAGPGHYATGNMLEDGLALKIDAGLIDSIGTVTIDGQYPIYVGADTVAWYIPVDERQELSDVAIMLADTVNGSSSNDYIYTKYQIDTMTFAGGLDADDVAAQINDTIVARLAAAVAGVRISDTASMLNPYINRADTAAMLEPYFTESEIRKADSDTIPIFVFGAGSGGLESDTALFTATNIYGAFYNDKDTIIATSLRAVLIAGTTPLGTDTLAIQVFWNDTINAVFAPTARLNTNYLPVTSTTLGTEDTSFNTSIIPPGVWVFCKSTAGTTGRKPKALYVTLYGFKRNRTY